VTDQPNYPVAETRESKPGQWKPGQSGNPKGRPKQSLVALQRDLEGAIRDHLTADKVKTLIEAVYKSAIGGKIGDKYVAPNVKAAKLLLDKLIPNATDTEPGDKDPGRTVVFRIENATFAAQQKLEPPQESQPIDVQVIEMKSEQNGK